MSEVVRAATDVGGTFTDLMLYAIDVKAGFCGAVDTAKVVLIAPLGLCDLLQILRRNRRDLFNSDFRKPPPFEQRHLCAEPCESGFNTALHAGGDHGFRAWK